MLIEWTAWAVKDMRRITERDRQRIVAKVEQYARATENDARIPHEVALAMMRGESGVRAFRNFRKITLRGLSKQAGVAPSYLSEIERGAKTGSVAALSRIAQALGTTIDALAC